MDVLESRAERERAPRPRLRLRRPSAPVAVLVALVLLAVGQVAALNRDLGLPPDVRVEVAEGGYVVGTQDSPSVVTFQLRNAGRPIEVRGVRLEAPGLRLVDVVASGDAVMSRIVGEGEEPLPAFRLVDGVTLVLTFEPTDCGAVDTGVYPVQLEVRDGPRSGVLPLRLRDYPDLEGRPLPDVPWQVVLATALCS